MNPAPVPAPSVFAALADPVRRDLLLHLAEHSPRTATELARGQFARQHPLTRQSILKHLEILRTAGLVSVAQYGRDKRYSLSPEPLGELQDYIAALNARWDERLLRLKTMLENEDESRT